MSSLHFTTLAILGSFLFSLVQSTTLDITSDKEALISFRSQLALGSAPAPTPNNPLSSWDRDQYASSPCNWTGVECDKLGLRVIGLNLSSLKLGGSISPYIGNLTSLESLQLQNNNLIGTIPNEVLNLLRLKHLNLSSNYLHGVIPSNITRLNQLEIIDLTTNNISGPIPRNIGSLRKLQVLNLARNIISGPIPKSIGNISSLTTLDMGTNTISGSIPSELARLTRLNHLDLSINNLSGLVPPSIYNMSSLVVFALASNNLWGEIPYDVGQTLPNLRVFYFCINQFKGRIPGSLHNLTNIQVIRMAHNRLTGPIPPGLENLAFLTMYNIGYNRIVSNGLDFISLLANSPRLNFLAFDGNLIEGTIPNSIGNLSRVLSKLYMGSNRIRGGIPSTISQLTGLTLLNMSYNEINGTIPREMSQIRDLQVLDLGNNQISGVIPDTLGSLTKLTQLDLSKNRLMGGLPDTFGGFTSLNSMDLSSNMLNGSIPAGIFSIPISSSLKLANNLFSGVLPQEIGFLDTAVAVDLCDNRLSGSIPSAISNCKSLVVLNLSRNSFSGNIPSSLGMMNTLETLDLSNNQLSGFIPAELQRLNETQSLNLSFNHLEGGLPCGGVFRNLSRVHLQGNPDISMHLECPTTHRTHKRINIIVVVMAALLMVCVIVSSAIYAMKRIKPKLVRPSSESFIGQRQLVKYDELRQATGNFSEGNVIGRGGFGSVFKGVLRDNTVVAIKVLDLKMMESWKSFLAECEALRSVRHRNLVKLITSCSSLDYKNMDFLALVYDYMSNGSLEDWIKGKKRKENGDGLNLMERLDVMIDVASAVTYLHHESEVVVVHCDLKPSNILLDNDMTAKVGDFGLATSLMDKTSENNPHSISSSHVLKGSIGYMPPEYGVGSRPSAAGDTYSFGVTLLEVFTGKSPNYESLTGEQNLVAWVKASFPDEVMECLLDSDLCQELENHDNIVSKQSEIRGYMVSIFEVGLMCSAEHPDGRISMRDALHKLKAVRKGCSQCLGCKN